MIYSQHPAFLILTPANHYIMPDSHKPKPNVADERAFSYTDLPSFLYLFFLIKYVGGGDSQIKKRKENISAFTNFCSFNDY